MKLVAFMMILLIIASPIGAQDATQVPENRNALNFCAAEIFFDLPKGWVSAGLYQYPFNVIEVIADSDTTMNKDVTNLSSSEALITLQVLQRVRWTSFLEIDAAADIGTILQASIEVMGKDPDTRLGEVKYTRLGNRPAVTLDSTYISGYTYTIGLDLSSQAIAFVTMRTGLGEEPRWSQTALDVAESLRFSAPSFLGGSDSFPLTESFAPANCFAAVAYPQNWVMYVPPPQATTIEYFDIQVANYGDWYDRSDDVLAPDQAYIDVHVEVLPSLSGNDPYILTYYANQAMEKTGYTLDDQTQTTILDYPAIISQLHAPDKAPNLAAQVLSITVKYGNYAVASVTLHTAPGELDQWRDTALAVAESVHVNLPSTE